MLRDKAHRENRADQSPATIERSHSLPDTSTPAPQAASTAAPTTAPTVEPATEPPAPTAVATEAPAEIYLGDAVEKDGYALTALSVKDPATPDMFYQAKTGTKLVGVEVILSNLDGDPLSVNPLSAVLVDDQGFTYQAELGGMDEQIATLTILPGERIRGWVAYQIPTEATVTALKYAPDIWGEAFKVGLKPPPSDHAAISEPAPAAASTPLPKLGQAVQNDSLLMVCFYGQE